MSSLISLHQSILEPILSDWLQVQHLSSLDIAACNKDLRSDFLNILSLSRTTSNRIIVFDHYNEYYDWLCSRGLSVNRLSLNKKGCLSESNSLKLILSSQHLTELEAPACKDLIQLITAYQLHIVKLIVSSDDDDESLVSLLKLLGPNLHELNLKACQYLSYEVSSEIAKYCPKLKRCIYSLYEIDAIPLLGSCPIESMSEVPLVHLMKTNICQRNSAVTLEACPGDLSTAFKIDRRSYNFTELTFDHGDDVTVDFLRPHLSTVRELAFCGIWSVLVKLLPHCEKLHTIGLCTESIDENTLGEMLGHFSHHLVRLKLCCPALTDSSVLSVLGRCSHLQDLFINVPLVNETLTRIVASLPRLRRFELNQPIPEDILMHKAVGLETMDVAKATSGNHCSFCITLEEESGAPSLEFTNNGSFSSGWFVNAFKKNPGLMSMSFLGQDNVNDDILAALVKFCPMLKRYSMHECENVTDAGLYCVTAACEDLMLFRISTDKKQTKLSLDRLLQGLSLLKDFHLCGRTDLESSELHWIAQHCPAVTEINISYCDDVRDYDVMALLTNCPRLKSLQVEGCSRITVEILPAIMSRRTQMRKINLQRTGISESQMSEFLETSGIQDYCEVVNDTDEDEEEGEDEEGGSEGDEGDEVDDDSDEV